MQHRGGVRRGIGLLLFAGIITGGPGHPGAAAAPDRALLRAEAGLGGFARPGRWTPVRVEIDNTGRDLAGEIVLEWGDARVHRAIDVPAPSRTIVELYIRTGDARGSMSARLLADGATLSALDLRVRIVADGDPFILCAASATAAPAGTFPCTATIAPQMLPRSMRGYAAADEVRLQAGAEAQLTAPQRTALRRWRTYNALDADGLLSLAPRAPLAAASIAGGNQATLFAAIAAFAALSCAAWVWTRRRAAQAYAAVCAAVAGGVLAAVMAGRIGPGSAIRLRHATTVQQIGDAAIVVLRATVEYPAAAAFALRAPQFDGTLVPRGASEQWLDADGSPLRQGTFGRGAREQLEMDGVATMAPFEVSVQDGAVSVRNQSNTMLTGCAFSEGFSASGGNVLAPGASIAARSVTASAAAFFSCTTSEPPVRFADPHYEVRAEGVTVVSVRLPDPATPAANE